MKRRVCLAAGILAAVLTGAPPLGAQQTISLEQARAGALSHSRTLRKALLGVDSALLTEKLQSYEMLPSLSASVGAGTSYPSSVSSDTLTGSLSLSLVQTLFDRRQWVLAAIDKLETRIAREAARAEYFGVLQSVDSAFYGALEARAAAEAAQSDLQAYQTHLALARAKLEAGIIPRSAYLQTQSETAARETTLIQSEGRLSVAEGKLASLTGFALPLRLEAVDFAGKEELLQRFSGFSAGDVMSLIEEAYHSASANNPSLSQYELARQKAQQETSLASAGYLPTLGLAYSHSFDAGTRQALDAGGGSLSLKASIPLDVWKARASVRAAGIAARQAELEAEDSGQSLRLEIQSAVYDCISSARSASSSQKALEYAEGNYQSVLELFRLSAASSSELSDAQSLVSASRAALITARYSFLANLSSLRSLAGLENESRLPGLSR